MHKTGESKTPNFDNQINLQVKCQKEFSKKRSKNWFGKVKEAAWEYQLEGLRHISIMGNRLQLFR